MDPEPPDQLTLCCVKGKKCPVISQDPQGFSLRDDDGSRIRLSEEQARLMADWILARKP